MIAVIFEVWPGAGRAADYFELAAGLKGGLDKINGSISIERFESLVSPGKFLSLSFWRDEASLREWRNLQQHREAQAIGRGGVFADYRLRVAGVIRDYGMSDRGEAPDDSRQAMVEPAAAAPRAISPAAACGRSRSIDRNEQAWRARTR